MGKHDYVLRESNNKKNSLVAHSRTILDFQEVEKAKAFFPQTTPTALIFDCINTHDFDTVRSLRCC